MISKQNQGDIKSAKVTIVSFLILLAFLLIGSPLLGIFGIDVSSFAIAGSFIIFLIAMEMILGIELFKHDSQGGGSIFPIAFPLIAGAGSITTILSLKAEYQTINIFIALTSQHGSNLSGARLTSIFEKVSWDRRIADPQKGFWCNSSINCNKTLSLPIPVSFFLMPGEITIYTDGASSGNPGPGGYGVVLISGRHRLEKSEGFRLTTNNRMELLAVIEGLEALKIPGSKVVVYTDSKYVADSVKKAGYSNGNQMALKRKKILISGSDFLKFTGNIM